MLHEHVIILSIDTAPVPRVPDTDRITVDGLGNPDDGIFFVSAKFGYMERPNVPAALRLVDAINTEGAIDCRFRFSMAKAFANDAGVLSRAGWMSLANVREQLRKAVPEDLDWSPRIASGEQLRR